MGATVVAQSPITSGGGTRLVVRLPAVSSFPAQT